MMKEIYSGVLSRSTAYRFENNQTTIDTSKLIIILKNLSIYSFDEFLFLHNPVKENKTSNLDSLLENILRNKTNHPDQENLVECFYWDFKDSENKEEVFYAYVAHLDLILNTFNMDNFITEDLTVEFNYIENYLLSIETWTLTELEIFPFVSYCFKKENRQILLNIFKKRFNGYKIYLDNWQEKYLNHLLNFSMNTLRLSDYDSLKIELIEIKKIFLSNPLLEWNLINKCRFLLLLIADSNFSTTNDTTSLRTELDNCLKSLPVNHPLVSFYKEYAQKLSKNNFLH